MIGAIVLGAGFSRRFGSDKRSHPVTLPGRQEMAMLCATCAVYGDVFAETLVVVREGDSTLIEALAARAPAARVVIASDAELGMGHSLAAGILGAAGWQGAFVALGDMPFVRETTLRLLRESLAQQIEADKGNVVVLPQLDAADGHPVGFCAALFPRLAALTGDRGARAVLHEADVEVIRVPVDDPGVLTDIDEPP